MHNSSSSMNGRSVCSMQHMRLPLPVPQPAGGRWLVLINVCGALCRYDLNNRCNSNPLTSFIDCTTKSVSGLGCVSHQVHVAEGNIIAV